jgi:hypothetical protein
MRALDGILDAADRPLGLLEKLRAQCKDNWGRSSELYFRVDELLRELANPNLHDIANMSFRVELWDRDANHVRSVVAASGTVALAHAAFDAASHIGPTNTSRYAASSCFGSMRRSRHRLAGLAQR